MQLRSMSDRGSAITATLLAVGWIGATISTADAARSGIALGPEVGLAVAQVWQAGLRFAQAGSIGGEVVPPAQPTGRAGKSVTGGESAAPPPAAKKSGVSTDRKKALPRARRHVQPAASACRSIAGTWSSRASGMANDTRFHADGTVTRPASRGTWSCKDGQYTVIWRVLGQRGPFRLTADGKQLIGIADGKVGFYRNGA